MLELTANEIVVGSLDGKISFGTKPTDTGRTRHRQCRFTPNTPKQRELTYAAILKRPELCRIA